LVRIFAVTEFLLATEGEVQALGQDWLFVQGNLIGRSGETLELGGNHAVVAGCGGENFAGEMEASGERCFLRSFQFTRHAIIVGGIGYHRDAFEIFGGGAEHGGSADVNVLDKFLGCEIFLCGGSSEWVEIDDHQVDGRDAVFGRLLLVLGKIAAEEEAAVDFGVQSFDAAAEHFWPAGELGNIADGEASFAEELGGAASGEDLDAESGEPVGKVHDSRFVENADERALHCHVLPPEKVDQCKRRTD